jgi:hypothetical protein
LIGLASKKALVGEFPMLVGDNTKKGTAADYCCSKCLLVITPTRALHKILFDLSNLVGDNTNKGGAADYCCSKCLLVKTPTRAVQTPTRAVLPIIVVPNACW